MRMNDRTERLQAALARLSSVARPTDDCPAADVMLAVVRAELDAESIRFVGNHAMECPPCAEAWRLAREIVEGRFPSARQAGVPSASALTPSGSFGRWGIGAAVTVAAVVATAFVLFEQQGESRDPRGDRVLPALESVRSMLPEGGSLPRNNCVLRWTGPEKARYTLLVTTRDLVVLKQARDLRASAYRVSAKTLAGSKVGSHILWQVTAHLPDGRQYVSPSYVTQIRE